MEVTRLLHDLVRQQSPTHTQPHIYMAKLRPGLRINTIHRLEAHLHRSRHLSHESSHHIFRKNGVLGGTFTARPAPSLIYHRSLALHHATIVDDNCYQCGETKGRGAIGAVLLGKLD